MKPISLDKRPCHLGPSINNRREKHGTENVPALDLGIEGYLLSKQELDKLVGQGFWNSRYETRSAGQPAAPAWKKIKSEKFSEKLEADLVISFLSESVKPIEITEAKISKLEFEYQIGGLTACNFTVSTSQDDVDVNKLRRHMDGEISVVLTLREPKPEKAAPVAGQDEPELPMKHGEGDDQQTPRDPNESATEDGIGPETRSAVQKAARKSAAKKGKR